MCVRVGVLAFCYCCILYLEYNNYIGLSHYYRSVADLVTGLVPGQNVQIVSLLAAQRTGAQQLTLQGNDPSKERERVLAMYIYGAVYGLLLLIAAQQPIGATHVLDLLRDLAIAQRFALHAVLVEC